MIINPRISADWSTTKPLWHKTPTQWMLKVFMNQSMVLSQLCHITAGKDYEAGSFSLSFPASNQGETRCANITIIDDVYMYTAHMILGHTYLLVLLATPTNHYIHA